MPLTFNHGPKLKRKETGELVANLLCLDKEISIPEKG